MHRFRPIDASLRPNHRYLEKEDDCLFLLDYDPGRFDEVKRLIMDFKKAPEREYYVDFMYKALAIWRIARMLVDAIPQDAGILVPIPPSRARDHPLHDDRMLRLLRLFARRRPPADVREMILTKGSVVPSHVIGGGRRPDQILANLYLDEALCKTEKENIMLVDDLITTGAHFKACKSLLRKRFPHTIVVGLFVARRVIRGASLIP